MDKREVKRGIANLRRLARILRTVKAAEIMPDGKPSYDQNKYLHECGAPACALGWWATRNLQSKTRKRTFWTVTEHFCLYHVTATRDGDRYDSPLGGAQKDFRIDYNDALELFDNDGCGDAGHDPIAAAAYIEGFADRRERSFNFGTIANPDAPPSDAATATGMYDHE